MNHSCNVSLEPSPVMARLRNDAAIPKQQIDLTPALTGYWCSGFEFHLPDWDESYANVLQLQGSGSPAVGTGTGKFVADSVVFDGASFLYRADEAALSIPGNVTFCAWVNPSVIANIVPVFAKGSAANSNFEYALMIELGRARWYIVTPSGSYLFVQSTTPIPLNTWTLLICGYDSVSNRAFISVNGGAATFNTFNSTAVYSPTGEFIIGGYDNPIFYYFTGKMNQVARWDRLLNLAERTALMNDSLLNMEGVVFTPASPSPVQAAFQTYTAPTAPANFSSELDGVTVNLFWTCEAVNAIWIHIWRSVDGGESEYLTSVNGWVDSYNDATADAGAHSYTYKLRAGNYAGHSDWSAEISVSVGILADSEGTLGDAEGTLLDADTTNLADQEGGVSDSEGRTRDGE